MSRLDRALLILHFIGLAMGFATSFANMAMGGLIAKAAPSEKVVLGRFPPLMSRIGGVGLVLLWVTGVVLTYTKYGGPESLPWPFVAKLAAVVLLTVAVGSIWALERRAHRGDMAAASRIPMVGMIAMSMALLSVVFAVLTFD